MAERCKILFISVPIGSGHIRAAQAVGAAVAKLAPGVEVVYANLFDFLKIGAGGIIFKLYLKILEYYPQGYGRMYSWGNNSRLALTGQHIISKYLAGRMLKYLDAVRPAAIVCTHATPAGLIAYLHKQKGLSAFTAAVVTDYVVHRLWVYPEIDDYFVASRENRDFVAGFGIGGERSHAFGIPVDHQFSLPVDREPALQSLGLETGRKTILMMGGGAGLLPMTDIITACEELGTPLQIIAVAGKNGQLYRALVELRPALKNCALRPLGFVNNVHELMAAADLLVSKPGGLTSAEALCRHLPMLIYRPIPGQEEANTEYLVQSGVACAVKSVEEVRAAVKLLLTADEKRLAAMRAQTTCLARPAAAFDIARLVLQKINIHN